MSHISDQLTRLAQTKELIRLALEDRGVRVQEGTPFHSYAELIGLIGTEGIGLRVIARQMTVRAKASLDWSVFYPSAAASVQTVRAQSSLNWSGFYPSAAASAVIE